MAIGFVKPRTLDPLVLELPHYKTYGDTVQYQADSPGGKPSVYIPKTWFKDGPPYPSRVVVQVLVSEKAEWNKE